MTILMRQPYSRQVDWHQSSSLDIEYARGLPSRALDMQKTSDIIWQDTQHQVLFDLIDRIKEVPFDADILVQLKLYAEHHFILEETYMETLDYPGRTAHVAAHDRFREELAAMLETDPGLHHSLQESLSDFLYKWLKLHVLGIDKKLEDYVLKSAAK